MSTSSPETEAFIGKVINNFQIQEVIGQGGMGIVLRAFHPELQSYAAIKIMRPELARQAGFYERFLQEARIAARLKHPNIANVFNFGAFEESYYLMMDYIEGPSMRQHLRENKTGLPLYEVLQIFVQIADVLDFSHKQGVYHRDLKPDNILLTNSIEPDVPFRAVITDFGLVKLVNNSILETQKGVSVGTPAYMSPEQCLGKEVDGRTDIYSLGVMLYEACTGQRPFPIRNLFDAVQYHRSGTPVSLKAHLPTVPVQLDNLVRRLMAVEIHRRPANAGEVSKALQALMIEMRPERPSAAAVIPGTVQEPVPPVSEDPGTPPASGIRDPFFIRVAYQDQWEPKTFPLGAQPLLVGRQAPADIILDKPNERYVSKRHCEILLRNNQVLLRDLGSMNGTFLGDIKLEPDKYYQWAANSTVRFGPFTLALVDNRVPSPPPVKESPPPQQQPASTAPLVGSSPVVSPASSPSPAPSKQSIGTTQVSVRHFLTCPEGVPNRVVISGDPILIGRAPDCSMVLDGPRTSRHHCKVQRRGNLIEVIDLNSTNGTFLQNRRLPANSPVFWDGTTPLIVGSFSVTLESEFGRT